jgi:hypothetical protein
MEMQDSLLKTTDEGTGGIKAAQSFYVGLNFFSAGGKMI